MAKIAFDIDLRFGDANTFHTDCQARSYVRVHAPEPLNLTMRGSEGPYMLSYHPIDEWDGMIEAEFATAKTEWPMLKANLEGEILSLSGWAYGSDGVLGNETYWFILYPFLTAPRIEYWGNMVLVRTDYANDDSRQ